MRCGTAYSGRPEARRLSGAAGVGGIREPHWHPSAWEINVILAGRSRWVFVGPNGTQDVFEADKGDVIFAPQGH